MRVDQALNSHSDVLIWLVKDGSSEEQTDWKIEAVEAEVLHRTEATWDKSFIVKAINVLPDRTTKPCYIDISLPERWNSFAFFITGEKIVVDLTDRFDGEFIPAIAIDCFGEYLLFYSKTAPDLGIEVLRRGLRSSDRKHYIAEDLGYILRDEGRFKEAAEMFQLAADEGPTTEFIYKELADCYKEIGELELSRNYQQLFDNSECGNFVRRINESIGNSGP